MTLSEYYDRQIPDYYDTMYLDGYTPQQISYAVHRKMIREYEARKAAQRAAAEANEIPNVKIISEVKIKRCPRARRIKRKRRKRSNPFLRLK